MKLQYPVEIPLNWKPNQRPQKPTFQKKELKEAIVALQKELKLAGAKSCQLVTNMKLNAAGVAYGSCPGGSTAQLFFIYKNIKYMWITDKYFRTADNIYALSRAAYGWRRFQEEKIVVNKEVIPV